MCKKTMFSLLLLAILNVTLYSQENGNTVVQKGWMMGAYGFAGTAGFAYPTLEPKANAGPAYLIGAVAQYRFGNRLALRTGLAFSSLKGMASGREPDFNFPGLPTIYGDSYETQFKHADLLLPIEGLLDLGKQRDRGVYIVLGAALGVALKRQTTQKIYRSALGLSVMQLHDNHPVVSVYNTIGLGYLFRSHSKTGFFVQVSGYSNALSNLIRATGNGDKADRAVVNWYGLGVGILEKII